MYDTCVGTYVQTYIRHLGRIIITKQIYGDNLIYNLGTYIQMYVGTYVGT